ncbi:MAG: TonB-dependent receptor [Elusimicrobia bacterium]|nr:TonB-dependent receptor [Elusimicrobiota bacterium]
MAGAGPRASRSRVAALLLACLPAAARAQAPARLAELVVTATRYDRPPRDLPARVTVLSAADLQRLPGGKLDEALAFVAGANQSRQDGAYSFSAAVSLRGLPTSQQGRTLVLLDGVPINTSATGGVNWNRLPIELVERVEVFKGPGSSLYGGDALGGVINIITRRPRRRAEAFAAVEAASYQSDGQRGMAAARASADGTGLYLRGYGFHGHSGGYNSTPEALRTSRFASYINRYYEEHGGAGLAGYAWKTGRAEFEYAASDDIRGEGVRVRAPGGLNRRTGSDTYRLAGAGKAGETDWSLLAYRQQELYRRLSESQTSATNYQRVDTTVDRRDYDLSGSVSRPLAFQQRLTLGGELKAGRVNGFDRCQTSPYATLNDAGKMDTYAVYLQDDLKPWDQGPVILASLRYDAARFYDGVYSNPSYPALSGPIPTRTWDALTWRASARQNLAQSLSLYASYSRGFRQPSLEDMVLTLVKGSSLFQGNPDLGPERLDSYELGADYAPRTGLRLSPSLYYSRGWDFIYGVDTGRVDAGTGKPISQNQNISSVDIYGAEAEADWAWGPAALAASYTFSRSRIRDFQRNPALSGLDLAFVPRHQAAASLAWRLPWVETSASWRYKGKQFSNDQNTASLRPYSLLGFKLWRRLGAGFTASVAMENALDQRYQESATDLAPGRFVKGTLTWEF